MIKWRKKNPKGLRVMAFFRLSGSFLGERLLFVIIWLVLTNALAFILCGEDENRAAHGKARYPFLIFLLVALLGGALGALIGHIIHHRRNKQFLRGLTYALLVLCGLAFTVLCIIYAEKSPLDFIKGMQTDAAAAVHFQAKIFSPYFKAAIIWSAVTGTAAFIMFGIDKLHAVRKKRRIPELWLLISAFIGGGAGALLGMIVFRHKIRHAKFYVTVPILFILQVAFLLCVRFG